MGKEVYRSTAEQLLIAMNVEHDESYIQNIMKILYAQETAINEHWEAYINTSSDDVLAYNKITCKRCAAQIQIIRDLNSIIYVGEE